MQYIVFEMSNKAFSKHISRVRVPQKIITLLNCFCQFDSRGHEANFNCLVVVGSMQFLEFCLFLLDRIE